MSKKELRKATVRNKYRLTMRTVNKLKAGDRALLAPPLFERDENSQAWVIRGEVGKDCPGSESTFVLSVFDEDARANAGKVRVEFRTYGGSVVYRFHEFFDPNDIVCDDDLQIQELFLSCVNSLLDSGALVLLDKAPPGRNTR